MDRICEKDESVWKEKWYEQKLKKGVRNVYVKLHLSFKIKFNKVIEERKYFCHEKEKQSM